MGDVKLQNKTQYERKLMSYIDLCKMIAQGNQRMTNFLVSFEDKMSEYNAYLSGLSYNDKGNPAVTKENIIQMQNYLSDMNEQISTFLAQFKKSNNISKSLTKVQEIINKDIKTFSNVMPDGKMTLPELIETKKRHVLDVGNSQVKSMSGNMSQRMPVKLPGGKMGLFTAQSEYNLEKMAEEQFAAWKQEYPELGDMFKEIEVALAEKRKEIPEYGLREVFSQYKTDVDKEFDHDNKRIRNIKHVSGGMNELEPIFRDHKNDPGFKKWVLEMANFDLKCDGMETLYGDDHELKIGDNIDGRNNAMSAVADMLGCSDIIAKSIPMTIKNGDKTINGTFMEFANGADFNNPKPGDFQGVAQADFKGKGLKSVANLGVLDYICFNTDRHAGNMLYQFDPNTHEFLGVVGIDNDLSFGEVKTDLIYDNSYGRMGGITSLKLIGSDMAQRIMMLSPEALKMNLKGYGLKDVEIDLAAERLLSVQNAIKDKVIQVVKDDEWVNKKIELYDPTKESDPNAVVIENDTQNIFSEVFDASANLHMIKRNLKSSQNSKQEERILPESKYLKEDENLQDRFEKVSAKLATFNDKLTAANKGLFKSSKQYKNMRAYAKIAKEEFAKMATEVCPKDKNPADFKKDLAKRAENILSNLYDMTTTYIQHKYTDGSLRKSSTAANRTLVALDLKNFVSNNCDKIRVSNKEFYRKVNNQVNLHRSKTVEVTKSQSNIKFPRFQ